jgi:hypothetical protein
MSYRNPQFIQQADPLAFSKGFEQAFGQQQAAFKADLEERERLAKQADDALASAYAMADLGPINGIDAKFNQALQDSLNNIVESGDFANASNSERAKMIQDLKLKKAAYAKIGEVMSVDTQDWDLRNDPKLSAFRAAILKGEDLKFDTKGLDFKVTGSFGTITLDDIANTRIINKAPYEEAVNQLNDDFAKRYEKAITVALSQGKSDQELTLLRNEYQKAYTDRINALDPDLKKYIEYNVAKSQDPNEVATNMFNKAISGIVDPTLIYNRPQPKPQEPNYGVMSATSLATSVGSAPETYFNRLPAAAGYSNVKLNNDLTITYNRPVEVEDEKGKIKVEQQSESLDLKNPGDFEAFARSTFEQFGGKDIGTADRPQAYLTFKNSLINSLNQKLIENQQAQQQQQTIGVMQPQQPQPQQQSSAKPVKQQILEIETFKSSQEITVDEKRRMTNNLPVSKKIFAELNRQKLPLTYANYDRASKYLGLTGQSSFVDAFLGRTKDDNQLNSLASSL